MNTIGDISQSLVNYFLTDYTFNLDKDFSRIIPIPEDILIAKESIRLALEDFEKQGLISKLKMEHPEVWILNKPLQEYTQTIQLSYPTIKAIAEIINSVCDELELTGKVDVLNVKEQDILSLVLLIQNYNNGSNIN